jgi:Flp pilus assembly protein TadG
VQLREKRQLARPWGAAKKVKGSTLFEFALVLLALLFLIFGVIDFGRALYAYHFVSHSAREASRWATVRGKSCNSYPQACPAQASDVRDYVISITPSDIDTKKLVITTAGVRPPRGLDAACENFPNNPGCAVQVQITYRFNFFFPFLPPSTYSMQSTSEMVMSQ